MHIHTTRVGPVWAQMLVEAGGKDLLMLTDNSGQSCLYAAARMGRDGIAKVRQGMYTRTHTHTYAHTH